MSENEVEKYMKHRPEENLLNLLIYVALMRAALLTSRSR